MNADYCVYFTCSVHANLCDVQVLKGLHVLLYLKRCKRIPRKIKLP